MSLVLRDPGALSVAPNPGPRPWTGHRARPSRTLADQERAASPPDYAYQSVLSLLIPLSELPIDKAPAIQQAVTLLQDRLAELQAGAKT
jgi:hypothetical protein